MILTIYGAITTDFKVMANLIKILQAIKIGKCKPTRLDCYSHELIPENIKNEIQFKISNLDKPFTIKKMEIFAPSENYPSHIDNDGISYFIPLESGKFFIDNINYDVIPFVLYAFNDKILHNTNFTSIMIK